MDTLPLINRTYELYKIVIAMTSRLEKRWRYSLGASLETTILECLSQLVMAKNAPKTLKSAYLLKAGSHQEVALLKLRLLLELNLANKTQIFQTQQKLAEIGRMIGGWLKSMSSV